MQSVLAGEVIPRKYLDGCLVTNPSLEDYAIPEKNPIAKEVDEFPSVLQYIQEHGLQAFSFDKPVDPQTTVEPSEIHAEPIAVPKPIKSSRKPGKRTQAQADWESVRNAAKTLWAENDQLRIDEVARRIKRMTAFPASAFTPGTIHKQIAGVSPLHIRGKHGRNAKKSP